jgi:DNA-binding LytR/AlgR family response regulator
MERKIQCGAFFRRRPGKLGIHLNGSSSFVRRGITQWDSMLPKPFFVRVERSLIIDLEAVRKVIAQDRDEVLVEVEGF